MVLRKNWKVFVLMVGTAALGAVINWFFGSGSENNFVQIAGEIPEPGTVLLFALGALFVRKNDKK